MRTYTRKRPEHQLIEGVNELCRLCLTKSEETFPIFTDNLGNVCASLALRIMICVGLEVTQDECLPNMICATCHKELQKYYTFRKKCEVSYQKLKSHLLAAQVKEYKEEIDAIKELKKENCHVKDVDVKLNIEKKPDSIVFMVNMDGTIRLCNETKLTQEESSITKKNAEPIILRKTVTPSNIPIIETINRLAQNNEKVVESNRIVQSNKVTESNSTTSRSNESLIIKKTNNPIAQSNKTIACSNNTVAQSNNTVVQSNNTVVQSNNTVVQSNRTVIESDKIVAERNTSVVKSNDVQTQMEAQADPGDLTMLLSTVLIQLGVISRHNAGLMVADNNTKTLELETGDGCKLTLQLFEEDDRVENTSRKPIEVTGGNGERIQLVDSAPKGKRTDGVGGTDGKEGKSDRWRVRCEWCGRGFASRGTCARHVRALHARARPHACRVCGRTFAQKEVCARHELVHQEKRPFACCVCPKSFTQRGALEAHARAHAPPAARPLQLYRCARCPKVFLYSSGLSRHMMWHNGRVYTCGGCQRTFRDKSSLKRHLRTTSHAVAPPR